MSESDIRRKFRAFLKENGVKGAFAVFGYDPTFVRTILVASDERMEKLLATIGEPMLAKLAAMGCERATVLDGSKLH